MTTVRSTTVAAFVVFIFAAIVSRSSDGARAGSRCANCKGPCYGGRCRGYCVPFTKWRLDYNTYRCIPRCDGFCLSCRSYRQCNYCRRHYSVTPKANGDHICEKSPVCDPNCISGCVTQRTGKCDSQCRLGYGLTSTHTCAPCDANCDTSTAPGCSTQGASKCDTTCKTNYFLDTSTNFCLQCDVNCNSTCNASSTCSGACNSGYTLDTSSYQCSACATGCNKCTGGAGTCDSDGCQSGYVYSSSTCLPCDPECASGVCTAGGQCSGNCSAGYGRVDTTPNVDSSCAACDTNCDPAQSCNTHGAGTCDTSCVINYAVDTSAFSGTYTCANCQGSPCNGPTDCSATGPGTCNADNCTSPAYTYSGGLCT